MPASRPVPAAIASAAGAQPVPPLATLRAEIDRIDDAVLDLLVERLSVVAQVAVAKGDRDRGSLALRPAREAMILRRLVQRAGGRFPAAPLVRIWRELLAVTTQAQTPFTVAVPAEIGSPLWDVARDQFGSATPLAPARDAADALRQLAQGRAAIALLAVPSSSGEPWWRSLAAGGSAPVRVIGRLPFIAGPQATGGLALAAVEVEPSGDDLTLLVIETEAALAPAALLQALQPGLAPRLLASAAEPGAGRAHHLVEIDGFHQGQEAALAAGLGLQRTNVLRIAAIGGYPRPLAG